MTTACSVNICTLLKREVSVSYMLQVCLVKCSQSRLRSAVVILLEHNGRIRHAAANNTTWWQRHTIRLGDWPPHSTAIVHSEICHINNARSMVPCTTVDLMLCLITVYVDVASVCITRLALVKTSWKTYN